MSDVLVYIAAPRAQVARSVLAAACQATGTSVRTDIYSSGALYQRLGPRKAPPFPDLVVWFGPYAARAAGGKRGNGQRAVDAAGGGAPVGAWASLPHAIGLAASSRNPDAARQLLDWLNGPDAAGLMRNSPWQMSASDPQVPVVDAEWGR